MTDHWADLGGRRLVERLHANRDAGGGPFGDAADYLLAVVEALDRFGLDDAATDRYVAAWRASGDPAALEIDR
jgi:hypothetical protein